MNLGAIAAGWDIYYSKKIPEKFIAIRAIGKTSMATVKEANLSWDEINNISVCIWQGILVEVVLYYPASELKPEDRFICEKLKSGGATEEHPMTIEDLSLNEHEQKLLKKAKKRGSVIEVKKYYIPLNK